MFAGQDDDRSAVVAMKIAALARVIQQSVSVTKVDVLRNLKHVCVPFQKGGLTRFATASRFWRTDG